MWQTLSKRMHNGLSGLLLFNTMKTHFKIEESMGARQRRFSRVKMFQLIPSGLYWSLIWELWFQQRNHLYNMPPTMQVGVGSCKNVQLPWIKWLTAMRKMYRMGWFHVTSSCNILDIKSASFVLKYSTWQHILQKQMIFFYFSYPVFSDFNQS